jgi:hypothetical protein
MRGQAIEILEESVGDVHRRRGARAQRRGERDRRLGAPEPGIQISTCSFIEPARPHRRLRRQPSAASPMVPDTQRDRPAPPSARSMSRR